MITRFTAWLLIVLAASPFTAPFSTCDLSILRTPAPADGRFFLDRAESIEHSDAHSGAGTFLDEDQFKNLTLTAATIVDPLFTGAPNEAVAVLPTSIIRTPLVTLRL